MMVFRVLMFDLGEKYERNNQLLTVTELIFN